MQAISELWASRNQKEWSDALAHYWDIPSVRKNLEIETRMDKLDSAAIKGLGKQEWYDFLKDEYFPWKFTGNWLPRRLIDLDANSLETLFSIREKLFALNPNNFQHGLEIAKSIKGLGWAGASGLLAVLFPKWFGTADKFVVKALCEIKSLPERQKLVAMIRKDSKGEENVSLNKKDAVLLIDIMRRKAIELNAMFGSDKWTPRMVDKILWATRDGAHAQCLTRTTS